MEENNDKGKSLFNAGVAKLMRIDQIKRGLIEANVRADFITKASLLTSYRNELCERFNKDEERECDGYERQIKSALDVLQSGKNYPNLPYSASMSYERYLSKLEYKYGYSMPDAEDVGHVMR